MTVTKSIRLKILIHSLVALLAAVFYSQWSQDTGEARSILFVLALGLSLLIPLLNLTYFIKKNSIPTVRLDIMRYVIPSFVLLLMTYLFASDSPDIDALIRVMLMTNMTMGIWAGYNNWSIRRQG